MVEEPLVTAFEQLNTTEKTPIIELNNTLPLSDFRDDQQTDGGTITDTGPEFKLSHSSAGDFVRLASSSRGRYLPGTISEVGVGVRFASAPPTSGDYTVKWGYFEMDPTSPQTIDNGFLFGRDKDGFFVEVIRSQSSTKIGVDGGRDKDGFNLEQVSDLDLTDGVIFQVQFGYYGYLPVRFLFKRLVDGDDDAQSVPLHTFNPEGSVSIDETNLKVGCVIDSSSGTGSFDVLVGGRQYAVIGDFKPRVRKTPASVTGASVANADDFVPVLSFKKKQADRQIPVDFNTVQIKSDQDVQVRVLLQNSLTSDNFVSLDRVPDDETAIEKDTEATSSSGGRKIAEVFVSGGDRNNASGTGFDPAQIPVDLPDEEIITVEVDALGTDAVVDVVCSVVEQW